MPKLTVKKRHLFNMRGLRAAVCMLLCLALFVPVLPADTAYGATAGISTRIANKEAALKEAKADLLASQAKYEKAKEAAASKLTVTDSDLKNVGKEFINHMVETAYEKDKNDAVSGIQKLNKLTVEGFYNKAKNDSSCSKIIGEVGTGNFEATMNNSLSVANINKALDFIDKCNSIRKGRGLNALKVSPYLMAGSSVSSALSSRKSHIFIDRGLFLSYDSTNVYENFYWSYDSGANPFNGWYTAEKEKADRGETSGISHFKLITSTANKQTGFNYVGKNYDGKMVCTQSFTKDSGGTAYTVTKFRTLFKEFIEKRKGEILEEKKAKLSIFKNKPDYLLASEKAYNTALTALKSEVKGYKPSLGTKNYSYNTLKVTYSIPKGFSGVYIYRSTSGKTGTFKQIARKTTGTYYKDGGLVCGKTYYYKVRFYKLIEGTRVKSELSSESHKTTRPAMVKGLTASVDSEGRLKLNWKAVSGAQNYEIYVRKAGYTDYSKLVEGKAVSGLILRSRKAASVSASCDITNKRTVYIRVRAVRTVNGKNIYGNFSRKVKIYLG